MGKAEVLSAIGGGYYSVRIQYNKSLIQNHISLLDASISKAEGLIDELETELEEKETEFDQAQDALDIKIDEFQQAWAAYYAEKIAYINSLDPSEVDPAERPLEPDENVPGWDELQQALVDQRWAQAEVQRVESSLNYQKLTKASLGMRLTQLQNLLTTLDDDVRYAWCADRTLDLTGVVETLEINGEPTTILIYPPGAGRTSHGGLLAPILGMTSAQAAFNFAIHPGWQKWKPTYRAGFVTSVNYAKDTGTVALADAVSHYQGLQINQSQNVNVSFKYMTCDAMPFVEGDYVVVEFENQDFSSPVVIGFVAAPKICCQPLTIEYLDLTEIVEIGGTEYILTGKTHDLSHLKGRGIIPYPHKHPRWRIVWADWPYDDIYCHQFSRGAVSVGGELVGLPESFRLPGHWVPFQHYYPAHVHLQVCCYPFLDEHGGNYVWPKHYAVDYPCSDQPHPDSWWLDVEEKYWYWMEDDEFYP